MYFLFLFLISLQTSRMFSCQSHTIVIESTSSKMSDTDSSLKRKADIFPTIPRDMKKNSRVQDSKNAFPAAQRRIKDSNRYDSKDIGPFTVQVADEREGHILDNFHIMSMGKKLQEYYKTMESLVPIRKEKHKVVFNSYLEVNRFMDLIKIELCENWIAYIPIQSFFRIGVIRGVDPTLEDEEIKKIIKFPNQLDVQRAKVQRMKKPVKNDANDSNSQSITLENTTAVKLYFRNRSFPAKATIYYITIPIKEYMPRPVMCYNYLTFGDLKRDCKSQRPKCQRCGSRSHPTKECISQDPRCANCSLKHETLS